MKPLRVEIEAFGSFADRQRVDFEALGSDRLFLIHGPTGAGKSTILEAICFALYGTPAGADASAPHLRSQHADPERLTRVTLWFALGDVRYRIERTPRQLRPKRRGEGFVEERGTALIERFKPGMPEDGPGEPLATKQSDVDAAVRNLLGLDRSQFRQVILLPQGEFRRLLEASSKERQEILSRLFDIDRYADLERRLKGAADQLRNELGRVEERRATLLGQAEAENEEAFALRRKALGAEIDEARTALEASVETERVARDALERGRVDRERLQARETAVKQHASLAARKPEFEHERDRLRDAVRAEPVVLRFDAWANARRASEEAARRLEGATAAVRAADEALEGARNDEFAARERTPELRGLEETVARLRASSEAVARLETLRAEHAERVTAQAALAQRLEREAALATEAQRALATLEEQAERHAALLEAQRTRTEARSALAARLERARRRAALETALARRAERLTRLDAGIDAERAELALAEAALREAQAQDRAAAAHRLAATLVAGESCPVCGSTEHPAKASEAATDRAPGEAGGEVEIEALEDRVARLRAHLEPQVAERAGLAGEQASETRALDALRGDGESSEDRADEHDDLASLDVALAEADRAIEDAQAALATATQASEALAERRAGFERLRAPLEDLRREHAGGEAAIETSAQNLATQAAALPAEARTPEALAEALSASETRRSALAERIEATAAAVGDAVRVRAEREATRVAVVEEHQRTRASVAEAEQAADQARARAGFEDERALRAAYLDEAARAELQGRVDAFDRDLESARRVEETAIAAAEGASVVDVEALATAFEAANRDRSARQDAVGRLEERAAGWARLAASLEKLIEENGTLVARYERIGGLANVAGGENPERVSFQRFVLAAFLDEVLALATVSLRRMSKGRYALQRVTELGDRRRRAGLDLAVWDAHTGQERPVATLSGGESFCAALALALGLADVVQRHSGGTRLDAIFVDEGFGSLDPESLELALATLVELQSGGRMVGLISHVPELQERIDTRIAVQPGRGGSSLSVTRP
ncbi:MAG: SMC family ATPase [bacterium]|nr:SMC family ATPase [bacterium]